VVGEEVERDNGEFVGRAGRQLDVYATGRHLGIGRRGLAGRAGRRRVRCRWIVSKRHVVMLRGRMGGGFALAGGQQGLFRGFGAYRMRGCRGRCGGGRLQAARREGGGAIRGRRRGRGPAAELCDQRANGGSLRGPRVNCSSRSCSSHTAGWRVHWQADRPQTRGWFVVVAAGGALFIETETAESRRYPEAYHWGVSSLGLPSLGHEDWVLWPSAPESCDTSSKVASTIDGLVESGVVVRGPFQASF
jgi:hypothetical protein